MQNIIYCVSLTSNTIWWGFDHEWVVSSLGCKDKFMILIAKTPENRMVWRGMCGSVGRFGLTTGATSSAVRRDSVNHGWEGLWRVDRLVVAGACLSRRLWMVVSYSSKSGLRSCRGLVIRLDCLRSSRKEVVNRIEPTEGVRLWWWWVVRDLEISLSRKKNRKVICHIHVSALLRWWFTSRRGAVRSFSFTLGRVTARSSGRNFGACWCGDFLRTGRMLLLSPHQQCQLTQERMWCTA